MHSVVLRRSPWTVINIKEPGSIKIRDRVNQVMQALNRDDLFECMVAASSKEERDMWKDEDNVWICFNGVEIISMLFASDDPVSWHVNPDDINDVEFDIQEMALEQLRYLNGVYKFELGNTKESHGFVVYFDKKTVTVFNTYGGVEGVFTPTFNRSEWIESLIGFNNMTLQEQRDTYHTLWELDKEMIVFKFNKPIKVDGLSACKLL
jgi:hypothetical protein